MKKNNLIDKKVISAMLVGISAMMAISSPITAYAEGEDAPANDNTEPGTEETATVEAQPETTAEAQQQAEVAEDAIEDIATELAPIIAEEETKAEAEDGGMVADEAVADVIETAEKIEEMAEEAAQDIENAEKDLQEAEKKDVAEKEAAREVVEIIQAAENAAEVAAQTVEETSEAAEEITAEIDQAIAEEDKEKAEEAVGKLETLVEQAQEVVDARKEELDGLKDEYTQAKNDLKKAEEEYLAALSDASADVQAAKQKLKDAKDEVNNLKDAVDTAQEKLETEAEAAKDLKEELENNRKGGANWDKQAELLKAYIMDYYIPQELGTEDVESITFEKKVKGFDRQDYTYYEFSYIDENGNKVTKYFNLDRTDKKTVDGDPYNGLGSSKEIVIFEKSELEVGADTYLRELYGDEAWFKDGVEKGKNGAALDTVRQKTKDGDFRVYSYEKDGKTYYIAQEQIEGKKADSREISYDENGNLLVDGCPITEVVQNKNNNTHGNPDIVVNTKDIKTGDEETDNQVTQFIKEADGYVEQYKEYSEAVSKAEDATAEAIEQVERLEEAIDGLKTRDNYVLTAAEALGVTDVAKFLGIEVPEDVDMDSMKIEEALNYLDELLAKANEKMSDAIDELDAITAQKDAAKQAIDELAKENDVDPEAVIDQIEEQQQEETQEAQQEEKTEEKAEEETQEEKQEDKKEEEKAEEEKQEDKKEEEKAEEEKQEDKKEEEKAEEEEKEEEKEQEIKDEEEAKEEEVKDKDKKPQKPSNPGREENNTEENRGSDEYSSEDTYEPTAEWTFFYNALPEAVEAENTAVAETEQILGVGRQNKGWTAATVIDMVNQIAEEQEVETAQAIDEITPVTENKTKQEKTEKTEKKNVTVTIDEETTPLAASIPTEKEAHMNWWWLLIVALLGVTGEEMYRKHREKELEQNSKK